MARPLVSARSPRPPRGGFGAVGALAAATALFVVVVVALVVVTVRSHDDADPAADEAAASAPVADLAQVGTDLAVRRSGFCAAVDEAAVTAALEAGAYPGADPGDVEAQAYDNGDLLPTEAGGDGTSTVAHEYGCAWSTGAGSAATVARAWVFAPPVTRPRAKRLAAAASGADGCATYASDAFGEPGTAYSCTSGTGQVTAGHAGLFGDAWLSCTLTRPDADAAEVQAAADAWCAAAALAAAGRRAG